MVLIKSSHIFLGLSLFASLLSVNADLANDVCNLVNEQRAKAGCKPVKLNSKLMDVAQRHNQYCVSNHILTHDDPAGGLGDRFKQCGYDFSAAGENVAEGFGDDDAEGVMNAWVNSPGHFANIVNPEFCDMGIVCKGGFCTQDFGKPLSGSSDNSDDSDSSDNSSDDGKYRPKHSKVSSDDNNNDGDNNSDGGRYRPKHSKVSSDNNGDDNNSDGGRYRPKHSKVSSNDDNNGDDNDDDIGSDPSDYSDRIHKKIKQGYKVVPYGKKPCPKKQ